MSKISTCIGGPLPNPPHSCEPPHITQAKWLQQLPKIGRIHGEGILSAGGEILEVAHAGPIGSFDKSGKFTVSRPDGNFLYKLVYTTEPHKERQRKTTKLYCEIKETAKREKLIQQIRTMSKEQFTHFINIHMRKVTKLSEWPTSKNVNDQLKHSFKMMAVIFELCEYVKVRKQALRPPVPEFAPGGVIINSAELPDEHYEPIICKAKTNYSNVMEALKETNSQETDIALMSTLKNIKHSEIAVHEILNDQTPPQYLQQVTDETLIFRFQQYTGWNAEKVLQELAKLKCTHQEALDFYKATGRLPTEPEAKFINHYSVEGWIRLSQNKKP